MSLVKDISYRFNFVRNNTEEICKPLAIEDYSVQPSLEVSPPKWHLAHTTWFWEQFVLKKFVKDYQEYNENYAFLFNSYYNNLGTRIDRSTRGHLTRPSVKDVYNYRKYVTNAVNNFIETNPTIASLEIIEVGINHEEQHQELLHYDIKYILGNQPLLNPKFSANLSFKELQPDKTFIKIEEGLYDVGYDGSGFCFDNELGEHKVYLNEFQISKDVVTNGEYLEFIEAGGYSNYNLWHSDGWEYINSNKISAPMYWNKISNNWLLYNYHGLDDINLLHPVSHISFYEAAAFAEWKGMRLPTESEWEIASNKLNYGQVWEWTNSAYLPYPNYKKAPGALGEYNGKFMVNQHVLRGSSIATPLGHSRKTYRNFFGPNSRWLFSGIRLVK